ncbi:hypothetical protein QTO34_004707 [Cnephaeus nilssonii]|uniref:Uncharacterized protein n=1 Tax=Cnephaeus nilssonii TaxID=3371016 RepID=A0AA40HQR8_CNENI|nr:hypothetical protein QTO34_004707 [Eptesicus nilssonii]
MGGASSTRRVTFEADENENITVVKGIRFNQFLKMENLDISHMTQKTVSDEELKRRVAEELALEQAKKESENQKRLLTPVFANCDAYAQVLTTVQDSCLAYSSPLYHGCRRLSEGLGRRRTASRTGPPRSEAKAGDLAACLLRRKAFRKPPQRRRLSEGLGRRRTASRTGPPRSEAKAGDLAACLLRRKAFRKPPQRRRLSEGLGRRRTASRTGPPRSEAKAGDLAACLLRRKAFRKPPQRRRLSEGLGRRRTASRTGPPRSEAKAGDLAACLLRRKAFRKPPQRRRLSEGLGRRRTASRTGPPRSEAKAGDLAACLLRRKAFRKPPQRRRLSEGLGRRRTASRTGPPRSEAKAGDLAACLLRRKAFRKPPQRRRLSEGLGRRRTASRTGPPRSEAKAGDLAACLLRRKAFRKPPQRRRLSEGLGRLRTARWCTRLKQSKELDRERALANEQLTRAILRERISSEEDRSKAKHLTRPGCGILWKSHTQGAKEPHVAREPQFADHGSGKSPAKPMSAGAKRLGAGRERPRITMVTSPPVATWECSSTKRWFGSTPPAWGLKPAAALAPMR